MATPGSSEKARKYLSLLDEARCNDRWSEIPELTRKVGKHSQGRQCLVYTARIECQLASSSPSKTPTGPLAEAALTGLRSAVEVDNGDEEDRFQAQATLAYGLLSADEKEEALAALPRSLPFNISVHTSESRPRLWGWTYVSAIKAAYVRDVCSTASENIDIQQQNVLFLLQTTPSNVRKSIEYSTWVERLLTRICAARKDLCSWTGDIANIEKVERMLAPFRAWYDFWEQNSDSRPRSPASLAGHDGVAQREIWRGYYLTLSDLLRKGYSYPPATGSSSKTSTARLAQSSELRKVEAIYETLLLQEVPFPDASSTNKEVDDWADQAMENWTLTCGSNWHDEELGAGGREASSRRVLAILYRAATRTFHSCSILRHLFAVHASLTEFELASKALDSYLGIVLKGKSRVEKSGKPEPGLDSDEAMLQTVAYGIEMYCSFGKADEATRAEKLSKELQNWLNHHEKANPGLLNPNNQLAGDRTFEAVHPSVLATVHRAIAISRANLARYALASQERSSLQTDAITHLRKSLVADSNNADDPKTLYSLALMLAETRDVEGAIATVKHALSAHSELASGIGLEDITVKDQQKRTFAKMGIIQCWHLLALLLSSRQEFDKAEAACEAALESFEDQGAGLQELDVKELSFFEKQHIIEVKITQALLLEVNGGAELAINIGGEALRLYAYLLNPAREASAHEPPKTSDGPVRHGRGSLFGRRRVEDARSTRISTAPGSVYSNRISDDTTRPPTMAGPADTHSLAPPGTSHSHVSRVPSQKLQKRPSKKSVNRGRLSSPARPATANMTAISATAPQINGVEIATGSPARKGDVGLAVSHDIPTPIAEQLDGLAASSLPQLTLEEARWNTQKHSAWNSRSGQLPYSPLTPRLPSAKQEQYNLGLLSKIWIFISALYRRAGLFEDSRGAVDEAFKLANKAELEAAARLSSARRFEELGWAGGQSVDEIWADAHAESAELSAAEGSHHEAMSKYETALSYFPDHSVATIGLSNLLLDIYTRAVPLLPWTTASGDEGTEEERAKVESSQPILCKIKIINPRRDPPRRAVSSMETFPSLNMSGSAMIDDEPQADTMAKHEPTSKPKDLDRLAARDRAFGLLSGMTKLGTSWDSSEAWFALARAYEESGQPDKAKEVLWWVVELEEKKPVRRWDCLGQGYSC